jgi:hypothetical protein
MDTKPSATLRFLEDHEAFTLEEFMAAADPTVSERTRYTNLQNAVTRGSAYRVRRGLYASNLGVYRDRVPNVYLVATKAAEDAVLTDTRLSKRTASRIRRCALCTLPPARRCVTSRFAGIGFIV